MTLPSPGAAGSIGANKNIIVDTGAPDVLAVSSTTADGTYIPGSLISITVQFTEKVLVTGMPQITLETGTTDRVATYTSGSNSDTLIFSYTVQANDYSTDLDYISNAALTLSAGTIKDVAGNNAVLTLAEPGAAGSLGASRAIVIDAVSPKVTSVTSDELNKAYPIGAVLEIKVVFDEVVAVTGTPQLALETGATDRIADYTSGSDSNTLVFAYTVQEGDVSADLDYLSNSALTLNGGTIKDIPGNSAVLTLPAPAAAGSLAANKAMVIDGVRPIINTVSATKGKYLESKPQVDITVGFSETVNVTGSPVLQLETGYVDRVATYSSGSGSASPIFRYLVQPGDNTDDLMYPNTSALTLPGVDAIKDAAGNDAVLTLPVLASLGAGGAVLVDTAPIVVNVTSSDANANYVTGQTVNITVEFSEVVALNNKGTLSLALNSGGVASLVSAQTSNILTLTYTIGAGHSSTDLDYMAVNSLTLSGGGAKLQDTDETANNAVLTLFVPGSAGSLGYNKDIRINTP